MMFSKFIFIFLVLVICPSFANCTIRSLKYEVPQFNSTTLKDWIVISNFVQTATVINPIHIWNIGNSYFTPDDNNADSTSLIFSLDNGNIQKWNSTGLTVLYTKSSATTTSSGFSGYLRRLYIVDNSKALTYNMNNAPNPQTTAWSTLNVSVATNGAPVFFLPLDTDAQNSVLVCTNIGQVYIFNPITLSILAKLSTPPAAVVCSSLSYMAIWYNFGGTMQTYDWVVEGYSTGIYLYYNLALSTPQVKGTSTNFVGTMSSLCLYRNNKGYMWIITSWQSTNPSVGKVYIHDSYLNEVNSWEFPTSPVTNMVLGNGADGSDWIITAHSTGDVNRIIISPDGTFYGPDSLTPHLGIGLAKVGITALAFNYYNFYDMNKSKWTGLPAIITGYSDGTVNMLLSNSSRWINIASPNEFVYSGASVIIVKTLHIQPTQIGDDDDPFSQINNLVVAFNNGTILILKPGSTTYMNFLRATPTQKYTVENRLVLSSSYSHYNKAMQDQIKLYQRYNCYLAILTFYYGTDLILQKGLALSADSTYQTIKTTFNLNDIELTYPISFPSIQAHVIMNNIVTAHMIAADHSVIIIVIYGYISNSQPERSDIANVICTVPDQSTMEIPSDLLLGGWDWYGITYRWTATTINVSAQ